MKRALNFNAGPAALPLSVLQEAAAELYDFAGTGMSVLEISHRSPEYEAMQRETMALFRELLGLGDDWQVLFFGGGASQQFAMVPMNLLAAGQTADYILTGTWSKKAIKEAKLIGQTHVAATTEQADGTFVRIPRQDELKLTTGAAYVHLTSNNTIFGTEWHTFPKVEAPLVVDASSDILCRAVDNSRFSMIYAGAQKNLGPAGVTVVLIRNDLLERARKDVPAMLSYRTQVETFLYNTPPCFAIYLVGKTLKWIKGQGGVAAIEKVNRQKADLLYGTLDKHAGFYKLPVEKESRSLMNVVFHLPSEELQKKFLAEAKAASMAGCKGHRSAGGIRFSIYNAVTLEWVQAAAQLVDDFARRNG